MRSTGPEFLTRVAGKSTYPGYSGDWSFATSAELNNPQGIALEGAGNLYIADISNHVIRKVTADGTIVTVVGTGTFGYSGDGGPANSAQLSFPAGVNVDALGNLYLADSVNNVVRKVRPDGTISTIAGNGDYGDSGDGGPATGASVSRPTSVAADSSGNLYILAGRIRKVAVDGTISTVPLSGGPWQLLSLASDASGNVLVSVRSIVLVFSLPANCSIYKIGPQGAVSAVTSTGRCGYSGDGGPGASAAIDGANGLAVDASGRIHIADTNNHRVREIVEGTITTIAGNGSRFSGDGGLATGAQLYLCDRPDLYMAGGGVATDPLGNLYIADTLNHRVRKVAADGTITTVAGDGTVHYSGDGGPAVSAGIVAPLDATVDSAGNLFIADTGNNVIRRVAADGSIFTVAGNGNRGSTGDGRPATSAALNTPAGVTTDRLGNLYIADSRNSKIRKVAADGTIATIAGRGGVGYSGDGGPATSAALGQPYGIVNSRGDLYIADTYAGAIRKVSANGIITTVPGARLLQTEGVAVDSLDSVYIGDAFRHRVLSVAGNGTPGYSGDGGLASRAQLYFPTKMSISPNGDIYVADSANNVVRLLSPAGSHALLAASLTHTDNFAQGQAIATYSVVVTNNKLAGPTSDAVTVAENLPVGLALLEMSGGGWTCSDNRCTRDDSLSPGASFEPITIRVTVADHAPSQAINQVIVTGGGSPVAATSDATTIGRP